MNDLRKPLESEVSLRGGDFSIEIPLGMGGFGITYRGCDRRLGRIVAIKEFFPYGCQRQDSRLLVPGAEWTVDDLQAQRQRFVEEGRTLARLRHPGIPVIYDIFEENETAYLVMEFVEGQTFAQYMEAQNVWCLSSEEAVGLITGACEALSVVHRAQLLHRDLKPANLMRCPDGQVMLIDFGASHEFLPETVHSQTVVFTAGYAPLEQYSRSGVHGPYSDVYSLAATLYYLLTGQKPLEAPTRAVGHDLLPPAQINPQISPSLSHAVMRGLELRPDNRPPTVDAFLQSLLNPALPSATVSNPVVSVDDAEKTQKVAFPQSEGFATGDPFKVNIPEKKSRRKRGATSEEINHDVNYIAVDKDVLPSGSEPPIIGPLDAASGLAQPKRSPLKSFGTTVLKIAAWSALGGTVGYTLSEVLAGPITSHHFIYRHFYVDRVHAGINKELTLAGMMWMGGRSFVKQRRVRLEVAKPSYLRVPPTKISALKVMGAAILGGLCACFWGLLVSVDFLGSIRNYDVSSFLMPLVNVFQVMLTLVASALSGTYSYIKQQQAIEQPNAIATGPGAMGIPKATK